MLVFIAWLIPAFVFNTVISYYIYHWIDKKLQAEWLSNTHADGVHKGVLVWLEEAPNQWLELLAIQLWPIPLFMYVFRKKLFKEN